MRRFRTLLGLALVALMSLAFTSCDEDADIAYTLDGSWSGYMENVIDWQGHSYMSNTAEVTFNSGYDSGDGYWLDEYSSAPWDYVANRIRWKVRNGMIYISFLDTREEAVIRNYHLDDRYFYGEIEFNSTNAWIKFKLVKTSSPNWNRYYWYGTNSWYDSWGYSDYSRKQEGSRGTDAQAADSVESGSIGKDVQAVDSVPALIRRPK